MNAYLLETRNQLGLFEYLQYIFGTCSLLVAMVISIKYLLFFQRKFLKSTPKQLLFKTIISEVV